MSPREVITAPSLGFALMIRSAIYIVESNYFIFAVCTVNYG